MAEYKGIQGYTLDKLSSDPTASEAAGRLWFNTSTSTWKYAVAQTVADGSWTSAAAVNQTGMNRKGTGSTTAAMIVGGSFPTPTNNYSEEFDGASWTVGNTTSQGRSNPGACGTQTAALSGSTGSPNTSVEEYDGTNWTAAPALNNGRGNAGNWYGPASAAQANGGPASFCEQYNGTAWSEVADLSNGYQGRCAFGTQTAAVTGGGEGGQTATELWNGSAWSSGSAMNSGRGNFEGSGISTLGIAAGGGEPGTPADEGERTESYDGSTWTTRAAMNQTHGDGTGMGGVGSTASATFCVCGYTSGNQTACELWSYDAYTTKTVSN